jgi:DNA polymerase I-like protein with 3'-5' exonuclease and polymerase domains
LITLDLFRVLTADVETSIFNKGNPFDSRNFCVSIHLKVNNESSFCKFYDEPDFITPIKTEFATCSLLVGHNFKFDAHWCTNLGLDLPICPIWDTMVAEFILSGQTNSFASLDSLADLYGLPRKLDRVKEYWDNGISTELIPRELVSEYGNYDVDLEYQVFLKQLDDPRMTEKIRKLILLSGEDLKVLQEMEYKGLKYNKKKSLELAAESRLMIDQLEKDLLSYAELTELNFDSDDQLSAYLYGGSFTKETFSPETSIIKSGPNKGKERTINRKTGEITTSLDGFFDPLSGSELKKEGLFSCAGDILKQLKKSTKLQKNIIEKLLKRADLFKLTSTYYEGIPKKMDELQNEEFLHGNLNQVVARTGRLSSSQPNLQNMPEDVDLLIESRY